MGKEKLSEEEIVKNIIAPNHFDPCKKPFKPSGNHRSRKVKRASDISKVLESEKFALNKEDVLHPTSFKTIGKIFN